MIISIIVAFDKNRLIGKDGKMPWLLSDDLKLFKQRTMGHPVIMGRTTWDNLPKKPLPGRLNIVVSRTKTGHEVFPVGDMSQIVYFQHSLEAAITLATWYCPGNEEIFVIGGKQIYEAALNAEIVDKIYVSEIVGDFDGDTYFPPIPGFFAEIAQGEQYPEFQVHEYLKSVSIIGHGQNTIDAGVPVQEQK